MTCKTKNIKNYTYLEDLRAPTPTPVITDDSDTTSSSSCGFIIIPKRKTIKPYEHPDIIENVLRKGEKPKLLELLHIYNLYEESRENEENNEIPEEVEVEEEGIVEDNIVIDITQSRENLVDNFEQNTNTTLDNTNLTNLAIKENSNKTSKFKISLHLYKNYTGVVQLINN